MLFTWTSRITIGNDRWVRANNTWSKFERNGGECAFTWVTDTKVISVDGKFHRAAMFSWVCSGIVQWLVLHECSGRHFTFSLEFLVRVPYTRSPSALDLYWEWYECTSTVDSEGHERKTMASVQLHYAVLMLLGFMQCKFDNTVCAYLSRLKFIIVMFHFRDTWSISSGHLQIEWAVGWMMESPWTLKKKIRKDGPTSFRIIWNFTI